MAFGKRNKVSLNIFDYNIGLLGESGVGKTSLINSVCTKYTGDPESVLFLEIGLERGCDALEDVNYINCPEWEMEYDELTNSAGFMTVCEDIINHPSDYPSLKTVVWDTYDQLITIAEKEVINMWNKECRKAGHPEKCANTINGCYSGFGRGEKKAIELMLDTFARLRSVGISTIVIGHCKNKEQSDILTGETFSVLTSDQQQNYFNALKKNLHFLALAYVDRTIAREKTGKKSFNGKDEFKGVIKEEARKIKFRDDGAVVDCKSRFSNIVPEIDLDADQFIKAITDAIKAEQAKSGKSYEESKKEQEALDKAKEERIAQAEAEAKLNKKLDSIKEEIIAFFTQNKTNMEAIKPVLEMCRKNNISNPTEITDIEFAKKVLEMTK